MGDLLRTQNLTGWLGKHPAVTMIRYNILVPEERNPRQNIGIQYILKLLKKELRLFFKLYS